MRRYLPRHREGQSLVLVVLFLLLIFLTIGLAIDGGMLYAQRRLLQNTADAACLAATTQVALGQDSATARQAAMNVIGTNLGGNARGSLAYTSVSELYNNGVNVGSGTGLTHGIEVVTTTARVALRSPANSYFLRAGGFELYTVAARAHCNATQGGGLTPFAVTRWRGYRNPSDPRYNTADPTDLSNVLIPGPLTDYSLPQSYSSGKDSYEYVVRDLLRPAGDSIISQWPGWGSDPNQPAAGYPGDPFNGNYCCLYSSSPPTASPSEPGPPVVIAGVDAQSNNQPGSVQYRGVVVLDLRQLTWPQIEYYNGLTPATSPQVYKDFVERYLLTGYPGPWVKAGQELAFHNGVSAGQVEKPFAQRYRVGDTIAAVVYNGTIYESPSFALSFPSAEAGYQERPVAPPSSAVCTLPGPSGPISTTLEDALSTMGYVGWAYDGKGGSDATTMQERLTPPQTFQVYIKPDRAAIFRLRALLSTDPVEFAKLAGSWQNTTSWEPLQINPSAQSLTVGIGGATTPFSVEPKATTDDLGLQCSAGAQPVTLPLRKIGAQTVYMEFQDSGTGKRRALYARLNVKEAPAEDFYAYIPGLVTYEPFEPGDKTSTPLNIEDLATAAPIPIGSGGVSVGYEWFSAASLTKLADGQQYNGVNASITSKGGGTKLKHTLHIDVASSAVQNQEYYLRLKITRSGIEHWVWYYIPVREPITNSAGVSEFVYALGYAQFRITEIGSNYVIGQAVSGLISEADAVTTGLIPRLLPWE